MTEQELKNTLQHDLPAPPDHFDGRIRQQLARLETKEEPRMKRTAGLIVAFALVLVLGTATALAAFNEDVNQLLYQVWPQAALALRPVNLACEDQGIRMEVISAVLDGSESLVTLTMQDLEGDRIDETMDLFDSAQLQLPYDGSGTCLQTGFDPETKTASFAVYMDFRIDRPREDSKVTFSVSRFLSRKQEHSVDLTPLLPAEITESAATLPAPGSFSWGGTPADSTEEAHQNAEKRAEQLRVLDTGSGTEIPVLDGVTLTGIGLVDGSLHVQIRYSDTQHTDNHGFVSLYDTDGNSYMEAAGQQEIGCISWYGGNGETRREYILAGENSDHWYEYIFDTYPEDLSKIVLRGEFTTAAPATEGDWHVTFPISMIRNEEP